MDIEDAKIIVREAHPDATEHRFPERFFNGTVAVADGPGKKATLLGAAMDVRQAWENAANHVLRKRAEQNL